MNMLLAPDSAHWLGPILWLQYNPFYLLVALIRNIFLDGTYWNLSLIIGRVGMKEV